ncbi:MAG: LTA synthase family protein [Clostridia bacterium]|nr:LTA synthase family protein [Clostridia bacterium]
MKERRHAAPVKPAPAWAFLLYLLLAFVWMELIFRLFVVDRFFGVGLFLSFLFTLPLALLGYLLCTFGNEKVNRGVAIGVLAAVALIISSQIVYYGIFGTFYILYSVKNVGQVMQFWRDALLSILRNLPAVLLVWVPVAVYGVFGKRLAPANRIVWKAKGLLVGTAAALQLIAVLITLCFNQGDTSPARLYTKTFSVDESMANFGVLTTAQLDIKYFVFGEEVEELEGDVSLPTDEQEDPEPEPVVYKKNVIDMLNFESLAEKETDKTLRQMHEYFASITPTMQNEYTGKFKGKNLIFIVAEGFSPYAVNETLTPTLYKLSHEGIQCTDYYTPGWGVSTSDGEYASLLGLMPASGLHSMEYSADRNMYFSLGNMLKKQGYGTYAYHNHTYTYYKRHKSHPNLGYTYKGIGNGLTLDYREYYGENTKKKSVWPNSDYLMAKATAAEYMDSDQPFHTYYLTVSGHLRYTFMGNTMSAYHKDEVADLPYESDSVKAYLACQIELDLMVKELIDNLESRGIAEETVIVLTADHYPYGLQQANETDYYSELAGRDTKSTFEKYRNTLIMWHKGIESIVVEEPTYSIDLLPTISNLFGLEYDSRLLMGRDFLSDAPALVCFADGSWVTEYGRYDAGSKIFTANEGKDIPENYVKTVSNVVSGKFTYSKLILKNDYYDRLFGE